MLERKFQSHLIQEIKNRFPGCEVIKNDSGYIQGIPDLLILYKNRWAMLECKINPRIGIQPNQRYYVEKFHQMSYAEFVTPENMEDVLNEVECIFEP